MSFRLFLICSLVLLGRPQDVLTFLQAVRPALIFSILAMAALAFGERRPQLSAALSMPESKRYLFFYLIMIVGVPFAVHKGLAFGGVFQAYLTNVFFFILLVSHIDSVQKLKSFMWMICISTLMYSFFGGILQSGGGGRFQAFGNALDPNDTAFVLLSLFPLCLYFVKFDGGLLKKVVAIAAVFSAIAIILQTGSRGGLLGFGAILLILLLTKAGGIKKSHKILFVVMLMSTFVLMRDKIDVERYMTLSDMSSDYNVSSDGGRLELWESAIDLSLANPLTGVGVECYPFAHFRARELAGESFLRWQYTHNSFLQVAAEMGLVGFVVFICINLRTLFTFLRVSNGWVASETSEAGELRALAGLMLLGFTGLLVSGFFLSQGYSIFFTLYFALAAALKRIQVGLLTDKKALVPRAPTTMDVEYHA